jgi:hypothetical protein
MHSARAASLQQLPRREPDRRAQGDADEPGESELQQQ